MIDFSNIPLPSWLAAILAVIAIFLQIWDRIERAKKADIERELLTGEATKQVIDSALQLIDPYQEQQLHLTKQVEQCITTNSYLKGKVEDLLRINKDLLRTNQEFSRTIKQLKQRLTTVERERDGLIKRVEALEDENRKLLTKTRSER